MFHGNFRDGGFFIGKVAINQSIKRERQRDVNPMDFKVATGFKHFRP